MGLAPFHTTANRCATCGCVTPTDEPCAVAACRTRRQVEATQAVVQKVRARREKARVESDLRSRDLIAVAIAQMGDLETAVAHAVVPRLNLPLDPPEKDRRAAFLAHLDDILSQAFALKDPVSAIPEGAMAARSQNLSADPIALNLACIACGGNCCTEGARSDAFLTVEGMSAQRVKNPDLSLAEIRYQYLSRLPRRSVRRSCVFHGVRGCTLPRDQRADICNEWQCAGRQSLRTMLAETGATRSVVVALAEDHANMPQAGAPVVRVMSVDSTHGLRAHDDLKAPALDGNSPMVNGALRH